MTIIDLCNAALDLVGGSTISDFSDTTPEANLCQRLYAPVMDRVLRAYPWNCAQIRTTLTPMASAPAWGYQSAYELPNAPFHCLRVLEVGAISTQSHWRIESLYDNGSLKRIIATDQTGELPILYIRRIEDPAELDPLVLDLMIVELAIRLGAKLAENSARIERLNTLARQRYQQAVQVDAREQSQGSYHETAGWIDARVSSGEARA